jgi:signal transduction histidine kinase
MMNDSEEAVADDIAAITRLSTVPTLLRVVCQTTGMGFAAIARVTGDAWTVCAVHDEIDFGLKPGGRLDVHTTLCKESRAAREPIVIDHASRDPEYFEHHAPRLHNVESYISVPIVLPGGDYFGNLCAISPQPAKVSDPKVVSMFTLFAELIALQLEREREHRAAESALQTERATAELREQFIAVLGHDLRNPLMAVSATAEVMETKAPNVDIASMARRIQAATKRMSHLIDDVMDFARGRLGAGMGMSLARETGLAQAFAEVVAECRQAHPGRAIAEHYALNGSVTCDRIRVQQLLSNLVANALLHGAHDHPVVVEAVIDDGMLVISVRNQGKPILAGDLENVFQPYWRDPRHRTRGGLGLGLYICCEIARAHSGTISVTSDAEDGTCFTARLPIGVASARGESPAASGG